MMSSSASVQRLIASLSLRLYSLESALYYVSGLLDEGVPSILDVENALLLVSSFFCTYFQPFRNYRESSFLRLFDHL